MNNITILKDQLEKRNILTRYKNKLSIKLDSFEPFQVDTIYLKNTKNKEEILILKSGQISFEYLVKQNLLIPQWITHWFQIRQGSLLKLDGNLLKDILDKAVKKAGNLNKLCKLIGMTTPTFYNFTKGKISMISVDKLQNLLAYLEEDYTKYNQHIDYVKVGSKISIKYPNFPINLNNKFGAHLLGNIVSDGCIYLDKGGRNTIRTKYSTSEQESIDYFMDCINKVYGKTHFNKENVRNCIIIRIGSSIIGDTLLKVGGILGHKAMNNGEVPWLIRHGNVDLKKHYLRAVFSDEGCVYVDNKRGFGYIALSRYKHLNNLTETQKHELYKLEKHMSKNKFPTGHITSRISIKKALKLINDKYELRSMIKTIPKLLAGESDILNSLGVEHRRWHSSLTKTSLGRYSTGHALYINKAESLKNFYKEIGFSLSAKQEKLKKVITQRENKNGTKSL